MLSFIHIILLSLMKLNNNQSKDVPILAVLDKVLVRHQNQPSCNTLWRINHCQPHQMKVKFCRLKRKAAETAHGMGHSIIMSFYIPQGCNLSFEKHVFCKRVIFLSHLPCKPKNINNFK